MLEVGDVLGQSAHGGHHQGPGQLSGCHRGPNPFRHGNAALGTCRNINVAANLAGLCNELEPRELLDQLARDLGPFTDQHDDVRIFEPHRKLTQPFDRVGVDLGGVCVEPRCAMQLAHCILVIVEDHNVHTDIVPWRARGRAIQALWACQSLQFLVTECCGNTGNGLITPHDRTTARPHDRTTARLAQAGVSVLCRSRSGTAQHQRWVLRMQS